MLRIDYILYPSVLEASGLVETAPREDDYRDIWVRKEIHGIVARQAVLRAEIDTIIAEIEG